MERLPVLAAELVAGRVDVIVTAGSEATRAAKQLCGASSPQECPPERDDATP